MNTQSTVDSEWEKNIPLQTYDKKTGRITADYEILISFIRQTITTVRREEQEKVVKILEGMITETSWMKDSPYAHRVETIRDAITAIKGEDKV